MNKYKNTNVFNTQFYIARTKPIIRSLAWNL